MIGIMIFVFSLGIQVYTTSLYESQRTLDLTGSKPTGTMVRHVVWGGCWPRGQGTGKVGTQTGKWLARRGACARGCLTSRHFPTLAT